MEIDTSLEKSFGFYIFFISGFESTLFYPLGYFLVSSYTSSISTTILFLSAYLSLSTIGKLGSHQVLQRTFHKFSLTLTITFLLGLSLSSTLVLIFAPSIQGLLISRLLSGLGSNYQVCSRKLLFQVSKLEKSDWSSVSFQLLWLQKLGSFLALVFSVLFANPLMVLSEKSFFVKPFYLMLGCLNGFMLGCAMILSFMLENQHLWGTVGESYEKLEENLEKKEEEDVTVIDGHLKEKLDLNKYIRESAIIREESVEESFNVDEVKFYSPREANNRNSISVKASLTDRYEKIPQLTLFDFNGDQNLEDPKSVNVSFGDETSQIVHVEPDKNNLHFDLVGKRKLFADALKFQMALTAVIAFLYEILPLALVMVAGRSETKVAFICTVGWLVGGLAKLMIFDLVIKKHSKFLVFNASCIVLICLLMSLVFFIGGNGVLGLSAIFCMIFIAVEALVPMGHFIISESVESNERETINDKSISFSLLVKIIINAVTPFLVEILGNQVFSLCSIGVAGLLLFIMKLRVKFNYFCQNPSENKQLKVV